VTDESHANYVKIYTATPEQLDQLISSTANAAIAKLEAQQRALKWPGEVNRLLVMLAEKLAVLETRVAELETR
jgi:hypothetical protein